jgi:hypothetical protein
LTSYQTFYRNDGKSLRISVLAVGWNCVEIFYRRSKIPHEKPSQFFRHP